MNWLFRWRYQRPPGPRRRQPTWDPPSACTPRPSPRFSRSKFALRSGFSVSRTCRPRYLIVIAPALFSHVSRLRMLPSRVECAFVVAVQKDSRCGQSDCRWAFRNPQTASGHHSPASQRRMPRWAVAPTTGSNRKSLAALHTSCWSTLLCPWALTTAHKSLSQTPPRNPAKRRSCDIIELATWMSTLRGRCCFER